MSRARHVESPRAGSRSALLIAAALAAVLQISCLGMPAPRAPSSAPPVTVSAYATGKGGAVASAEPAATEAGLEILKAGGDAVDAAVAVALALAVVHPQAGNLGGGGFAVVKTGDEVSTLDFRETAPAAARRDMYLDRDGKKIADASWVGPLAAAVPGSPDGLFELHRRFGRLPWSRVVVPALRLAQDGFDVTPRLRAALDEERDSLARYPESAAVWLVGGKPPEPGTHLRLPDLAATLAAYGAKGPEAINRGTVAAAIVSASRSHGGVLTAGDLASYHPVWREPLRFRVFGWEVAAMRLPSSGGLILAESAGLLERLGWERLPRFGVERAHLMIESWRRAYADRFLLGDPSTTHADAPDLLSSAWLDTRAAGIDRARATPSAAVEPRPVPAAAESAETTHLSIIDDRGDLVALTTTLNGWFGCYLNVPGAGFFLNNEMDDFTTAPGLPNAFGLIQGEANAVAPGKRMLSSMSPTIAWRGGEEIALGSPGGSRIPTATLQVLLDLTVDGEALLEAVTRPRLHHQWLPDQVVVEEGALAPEAAAELERRGHRLRGADWRIGEVDVVRRRPDGALEAAADPRGPGGAGVVDPGR
ncbi:MAG TPA: gamma-glutamyltransferase [Candidatus Polarisedimenticolia bacterium]|nr:gamma-glutamyltransferase [Candidatus Polarisedimenticolia bacterium]